MSDNPQIHPIYQTEEVWLHLTPSGVLLSQNNPTYRFGKITE